MESSVLKRPRPVRRRLRRVVQQSRDAEYARRCAGVLTLYATGNKVSETARRCHARRETVRLWRTLYETAGEVGLEPRNRGREDSKATASVLGQLDALVRTEPTDMGYLRTGWSSELLALELSRQGGVNVHATTIQRWLARLYNDGIHDSLIVRGWLARPPRIKRLFQPVYHPWVNHIERLWKQPHDTVTRNHRGKDLDSLMNAVRRCMQRCQPFPGRHPALATAA